jgi:hypothetical protein
MSASRSAQDWAGVVAAIVIIVSIVLLVCVTVAMLMHRI